MFIDGELLKGENHLEMFDIFIGHINPRKDKKYPSCLNSFLKALDIATSHIFWRQAKSSLLTPIMPYVNHCTMQCNAVILVMFWHTVL